MKNKIFKILTGLFIAGFFSTPAFALNYYLGIQNNDHTAEILYIPWSTSEPTKQDVCSLVGGTYNTTQFRCEYTIDSTFYTSSSVVNSLGCFDGEVPISPGYGTLANYVCGIYVDPCSSNTDTRMLIVSQTDIDNMVAGDSTLDQDGCSYAWSGTASCIDSSQCLVSATGSGTSITGSSVSCTGECNTFTDSTATTANPETWLYTKLAISLWDKITDTVVNGDGSVTDTYTTTNNAANDAWDSITYDGEYYDHLINEGSSSDQLEVEVTTTQVDGSSTSTTTTTTANTSGSVTNNNINASTGAVTTTSTPSVTTTTTETTTQNIAADGTVLSETTTSDTLTEQITDPNATACGYADFPDCKITISNEGVKPDSSGFNNTLGDYSLSPSTTGVSTSTFSFTLGNGQACSNLDYSFTIQSYNFNPDLCYYLNILTSILYFLFAVYTAWFVFDTVTTRRS